jgi:hypothetical protein
MKCPICEREGSKSTVTKGATWSTCMAGRPAYWDEDGVYHPYEDPNTHTTQLCCSNGHESTLHRRRGRKWLAFRSGESREKVEI